ncbi:phage major capsid protein [Erwinia psidii]|uniref:Phage major capsid protein n=1 Tax=Erwinia psidii TaxID=69224 RepID=A0A3N6RWZ2_9GAMM|nr:phage major capsid protein [Erwinia psidii]MCX8959440.1 phage major capsid protein [Erwinia psidii]MCX8962746.1 phage major capsid protein [Erwinia psidii]MCX8964292.1 phage major capsid protein [Erwinia psidii]RQM36877.1 phage major capsid protein [Erwinia psidii]
MKKLLELRQQKAALKTRMHSIMDKATEEKRNLNADEGKQFDELRAQAESLDTDISRLEVLADEERHQPGRPVDGKNISNDALRHYILTGETRALSTAEGSDGGYTVIPELDREIMRQLNDESVMRKIATVKTTKSNEYKKLVSVGGAVVNHGEEGKARAETGTPKLEEVSIKLFPVYAYPKTTQEILDFSDVDILGWLSSEISDTFTETEETDLVNGDGSKKATGFLSYPRAEQNDKTRPFGTLEKMVVNAVQADDLIDLIYKLKAKYRKNAVWVMSSSWAAALQKVKNNNGDYIWRDRLTEGSPDTLLGRPVYYLENMSEINGGVSEPGAAVIAVGDFKRGYYIVDHTTGVRTRPDNITEPGFYKVHTDKYLGGGLVDSRAIKVLELGAASE